MSTTNKNKRELSLSDEKNDNPFNSSVETDHEMIYDNIEDKS